MLLETKNILGTKVLQEDTGELLALLNLPIIDPDTGVIEAFWVKPAKLPIPDAIVQTSAILAFKKNIYVESASVISDPADVIRISEILEEERGFMNALVEGESGKRYGHINNISFSTDTFVIRQIHTSRALGLGARIFPYERIVHVLPEKVIISDDASEKEAALNTPAEPA